MKALAGVVLTAWATTYACTAGPAVDPPPLTVEFAGCATVRRGPICDLPSDRTLWLWARSAPQAQIEVTAPAGRAELRKQVHNGQLHRVVLGELPKKTAKVTVVATARGHQTRWALPVRDAVTSPFEAVDAAISTHDYDKAEAGLFALLGQDINSETLAQGLGRLGRVALRQGREEVAVAHLRDATAAARVAGLISERFRAGLVLTWTLCDNMRRFDEARAILDGLTTGSSDYPEGEAHLAYHRAQIASESGMLREALRQIDDAEVRAERLNIGRLAQVVPQLKAGILEALGRSAEAFALLKDLLESLPADAHACERATGRVNLAWAGLLLRKASAAGALETAGSASDRIVVPTPDAIGQYLEEALELLRRECPFAHYEQIVLLNLAITALEKGNPRQAQAHLDEHRKIEARQVDAKPDAGQALWRVDIEAQIAMAENKPADALRLYDRLARVAAESVSAEGQWRAALGRARALELLERTPEALQAYAEAEKHLDSEVLRVPLAEGRETLVAERGRSAQLYVNLLLRLGGREQEALGVARRARARALRSLWYGERLAELSPDSRERWEMHIGRYRRAREALDAAAAEDLAKDLYLSQIEKDRRQKERAASIDALRSALDDAFAALGQPTQTPKRLPALADGEALLMIFRLAPRRWAIFVGPERALQVKTLENVDERNLAADVQTLLGASLWPLIAQATQLHVLPHGPLYTADIHAMPVPGGRLIEQMPIVYGLDLPRARVETAHTEKDGRGVGKALIVADPDGSLSGARRAARGIALSLDRAGFDVNVLVGDAATGEAVRAALSEVDLFHYAGHAEFAGRAGWASALQLAADGRLTVSDILALPRVPGRVVLSGCETGRAKSGTSAQGIGIAQAFLSAGAAVAVATTRPVSDLSAAQLSEALFKHGFVQEPPGEAAARALQQTLIDANQKGSRHDGSAFRVFVP